MFFWVEAIGRASTSHFNTVYSVSSFTWEDVRRNGIYTYGEESDNSTKQVYDALTLALKSVQIVCR